MPVRNVILIGYRGCGKTSVGRAVAARLGWTFVDTDERIEAGGRSIREIFNQDGEPFFRQIETEAIDNIVRGTRQVIAVGGGAVLSAANCATLRAAGLCIWLTAPDKELHARLLADPRSPATRPALTPLSGLDEIRHLLSERDPLYAATAHLVVPTTEQSVAQVVEAVLNAVAERRAAAEAP
jgi:shikimate kinase